MTSLSTTPQVVPTHVPHTTYTLGRSCWTSREYSIRIRAVNSRQNACKFGMREFSIYERALQQVQVPDFCTHYTRHRDRAHAHTAPRAVFTHDSPSLRKLHPAATRRMPALVYIREHGGVSPICSLCSSPLIRLNDVRGIAAALAAATLAAAFATAALAAALASTPEPSTLASSTLATAGAAAS